MIDDKSTDRTPEIADAMAAADPHVRVIHHDRNRKLGGSMKTGFAAATGDLVLYTDADLPFDMAELPRAVRLLREYEVDIISAYRFDRTGEGSLRAVYTFVYNTLIKTLFGVKVRDINFAFKLCRRRIFDHVELKSEGSFIDAELIIRSTRLGFEIMQMGVDYFPQDPRREHAELARGDRHDPAGDVGACARISTGSRGFADPITGFWRRLATSARAAGSHVDWWSGEDRPSDLLLALSAPA